MHFGCSFVINENVIVKPCIRHPTFSIHPFCHSLPLHAQYHLQYNALGIHFKDILVTNIQVRISLSVKQMSMAMQTFAFLQKAHKNDFDMSSRFFRLMTVKM